jgi:hypothetical protein
MLIQVDGWFGAGKSVLWLLLDSHPEIFASPIHDYSYCAFIDQSNQLDWVKTKHIEIVRKALARTQYYKFEKVFWDGFLSHDFSATEVLKVPYSLNYYDFDKTIFSRLVKMPSWTLESIVDTIYTAIFEKSSVFPEIKKVPSYFASMSNALFYKHYQNMPTVFPKAKSIQVRRSIEKIIATRSNRRPRPEDCKTWNFFCDSFQKRINDGEVESILAYYAEYDRLMSLYPDYFFMVDFSELVNNTAETMKRIADFIGISFDPILTKATHMGIELELNGRKYVGQENDNIEQLLSPDERSIINDRIKAYNSLK